MPVSGRLESAHPPAHLHKHGSSVLEHHNSNPSVFLSDCLSSKSSTPNNHRNPRNVSVHQDYISDYQSLGQDYDYPPNSSNQSRSTVSKLHSNVEGVAVLPISSQQNTCPVSSSKNSNSLSSTESLLHVKRINNNNSKLFSNMHSIKHPGPDGQKLTFLMQQAMQPLSNDDEQNSSSTALDKANAKEFNASIKQTTNKNNLSGKFLSICQTEISSQLSSHHSTNLSTPDNVAELVSSNSLDISSESRETTLDIKIVDNETSNAIKENFDNDVVSANNNSNHSMDKKTENIDTCDTNSINKDILPSKSIDVTIESVLDKIRSGHSDEVELHQAVGLTKEHRLDGVQESSINSSPKCHSSPLTGLSSIKYSPSVSSSSDEISSLSQKVFTPTNPSNNPPFFLKQSQTAPVVCKSNLYMPTTPKSVDTQSILNTGGIVSGVYDGRFISPPHHRQFTSTMNKMHCNSMHVYNSSQNIPGSIQPLPHPVHCVSPRFPSQLLSNSAQQSFYSPHLHQYSPNCVQYYNQVPYFNSVTQQQFNGHAPYFSNDPNTNRNISQHSMNNHSIYLDQNRNSYPGISFNESLLQKNASTYSKSLSSVENSPFSNTGTPKKRCGDKTKSGPKSKRKKIESDEEISESLINQLRLSDYSQILQEPLVSHTLYLMAPTGGQDLKNEKSILEAESKSHSLIDRVKKYELNPYAIKACCPTNSTISQHEKQTELYVIQNLKDLGKSPNVHPVSYTTNLNTSYRDTHTPEPPICATPVNIDLLSLIGFFKDMVQPINDPENLNRSKTPLLQLTYPPVIQKNKDQESENSSSLPTSSSYLDVKPDLDLLDTVPISIKPSCINNEKMSLALTITADVSKPNIQKFQDSTLTSLKNISFNIPVSPCKSTDIDSIFKIYPEEKIKLHNLQNNQTSRCTVCKICIVPWQYIKANPDSGRLLNKVTEKNEIFCSISCLTFFLKKLNALHLLNSEDAEHNWEYVEEMFLGGKPSSRKILIKGPAPKTLSKLNRYSQHDHFLNHPYLRSNSLLKKRKGVLYRRFKPFSRLTTRNSGAAEQQNGVLHSSPSLKVDKSITDTRVCLLCHGIGDANENSAGRMLNKDVDNWLHINCALWCYEVYETISGALIDPNESSYARAEKTQCHFCGGYGAGLPCYRSRCGCIYHIPCARSAGCMFFTDRGMYCPVHKLTRDHPLYMPNISANRKVYFDRDSDILVGSALLNNSLSSKFVVPRIGSLIVFNIGRLSIEQMLTGNFNDSTTIFPIGYRIHRIYWSPVTANKRCQYECCVYERNEHPVFFIQVWENKEIIDSFEDTSCDAVWKPFLDKISVLRQSSKLIRLYPEHLRGKDLFGLTNSHIVRACESLPGIEALSNYNFRFGRLQNIRDHEPPEFYCLSGAARCENRKTVELCHRSSRWSRSRFAAPTTVTILQSSSTGRQNNINVNIDYGIPNSKANKIQQYKRLSVSHEWKLNVYLGVTNAYGMGLIAARNLEKHSMIIEMIGELIRDQIATARERIYKSRHQHNIILMRITKDLVLDATNYGNLARFIRHSCDANCSAEILIIDSKPHLTFSASRNIVAGEELTFEFKVDRYAAECSWNLSEPFVEPSKVPCLCGAANCKKWIN